MVLIAETDALVYISGHAGAAPPGESVPCEAVTVLCNTLAASLHEITKQPEKVLAFESGNVVIDKNGLSAESDLLVRSFLLGLQMVSEAYPEYIQMTKR